MHRDDFEMQRNETNLKINDLEFLTNTYAYWQSVT
jgi:hypothetical protein